MTTYYFEPAGSNANAGTDPALPKQNLDSFTPAAGDVMLVSGTIRSLTAGNTPASFSNVDGCTLAQWNKTGCQRAILSCDVQVTGTWTQDGTSTNVWSADVPTGLALQSAPTTNTVMVGAGFRVDAFGHHCCFLTRRVFTTNTATTLAAMVAWEYYYDSAAGKLYVRLDGFSPSTGADPSRVVSWTKSGQNGIVLSNCDGWLFDGVSSRWANDPTSGVGYSWQIVNCVDCIFRDCESINFGYHGFGFTTSNQDQDGHRLIDCIAHGSVGGTHYVYYASAGAVTDCKGINCSAYLYGKLNPAGTPLSTTDTMVGFFSHTNDASTPNDGPHVEDVEWIGCVTRSRPDSGFGLRSFDTANAAASSDIRDASTYAVRCIDCRVYGGVQQVATDSMSFIRCYLNFNFASVTTAASSGGGAGTFRMNRAANLGSQYVCMESCVIAAHMDISSGAVTEFLLGFSVVPGSGGADKYGLTSYESRMILDNCTIMEMGAPRASSVRALISERNDTDPRTYVEANQCLFGYAYAAGDAASQTHRLCTNDGLLKDQYLQFADCAYLNISTNGFSTSSGPGTERSDRNAQSEWAQRIDAGLIVPGAYPLLNGGHAINPELTTAFKATTKRISGAPALGFNLRGYSGQYGANQYGTEAELLDPTTVSGSGHTFGFGF